MATILIPTPLRKYTGNSPKLTVSGDSVNQVIGNMTVEYPDIQNYLFDSTGALRSFINIYVDEDDIKNLQQQDTSVKTNSVISIIPAIAGGII